MSLRSTPKAKKKKMLSRCFCLAKQRMQKQNQIELTVQAWRLTFLLLNLVATETHIKRSFSRPSSPTLKSQHGHHHHRRAKRSARRYLLGFDTRSKPQEDYCTRSPKKSIKRSLGCLALDLQVHNWSRIYVVRTTRSLDPWKKQHFPFALLPSRLETRSSARWEKLDHQSGWLHGRKDEMDGWVDRFLLHLNLYATTNGSTNFSKALISRKSNSSNWNFAKGFGRKVMWFSIM